jgi:preprotein translocase subunit SecB
MRFIIALRDSLGNCRRPGLTASCAALPCMVPARPMSTPPPAGPAGSAAPPQQATSPLTIHGQYIKDLSFENPRAPQSLIEQKQPQLTLNVNVATRQFETKTFEVTMTIEASAVTAEKEPLFMLELVYAGTVSVGDVPQDAIGPLLLIETPRLLFPFARAIVANATREAGFPPLNIAPVDFVALYRQQLDAAGGKIPGVPTGPVGHA